MTALTWALNVVAVAGAAWAVTWGSIGWSAGRRAGVGEVHAISRRCNTNRDHVMVGLPRLLVDEVGQREGRR